MKNLELLIRDIPNNLKEVHFVENLFTKQGMNLIDPATNFILEQK